MNGNDKKIFELKKKLEERKTNLGEKPSNHFKTNCIFTLFGTNYNLHTMNEIELNIVFSWLKNLNNPTLQLNGFTVGDYLTDILAEMVKLDYNKQYGEIVSLESKLDALISAETKTSIEIDKLADMIG